MLHHITALSDVRNILCSHLSSKDQTKKLFNDYNIPLPDFQYYHVYNCLEKLHLPSHSFLYVSFQ